MLFTFLLPSTAAVISIDSGGAASGAFVADTDFSGGTASTATGTIDTSAVTNPAPQAVYLSERYGACTYTIPGLTPYATYTVDLHFAEYYWTAAGQRKFNVLINGTQVLTNFDIIASAGASKKAIVKSFTAIASSTGQVVVQFTTGTADLPKISGMVVTGAAESAYGGSAAAIPGTVQAENYDVGGESVAYHDSDPTNTGGVYRTDGVDIQATTDTGGGYNVGWTNAGEWLRYSVNVAAAGVYTVSFRVASMSGGGSIHLANSAGTNLTGAVPIPSTGAWQMWTTVSATATLPAGNQVLTVAIDSAGFNFNSFTASLNAPAAPLNLTAAAGNGQVALAWTASANASSYSVYRGTSAGGESSTAIATVGGTSYTNTGLVNGTKYFYTVKASNIGGTSPYSNEASSIPLPPPPSTPTGLAAAAGDTKVTLTWSGGTGATSFNIYRGLSTGNESPTPVATNVSASPYVDTGLVDGTAYFYTIKAVNIGGTSAFSNEAAATPVPPVPAAPTALAATPGDSTISLGWTASSGASSYNVYRGPSMGGEAPSAIASTSTATYVDTHLTNGVTYYYVVKAVNLGGISPASNEASTAPNGTERPYGGVAATIPGTVECENYDLGGEGIAFHDGDTVNSGGGYRTDAVDVETCGDLSGGFDIGWTNPGEWMKYTVNVTTAGTYRLQTRVACNGPGGTFHYNVDGATATSTLTVPNTGGWQTWETVATSITLTAGQHVIQLMEDGSGSGGLGNFNSFTIAPAPTGIDFGPNVLIFDPSMPAATIQAQVNSVYNQQRGNQFGGTRYALLFKPGTYALDLNVGYYTQALGLGSSPDSVLINGYVQQQAALGGNNATCNFWSGAENMAVNPVDSAGVDMWAVSQADPFRRMHVLGGLVLTQNGGWGSGGFISDSVIDGKLNLSSQQQWISRNSQVGSVGGGSWNEVFVGVNGAPATNYPGSYTTVDQSPVTREKPFLTVDGSGNYSVFVPAVQTNTSGTTWATSTEAGTSIPISQFYIAHQETDTSATLNAALAAGKNLLLTPGTYHLTSTLQVTNPNTVILGIGIATLEADNGVTAMTTADVDGVVIAGVLFDAGTTSSPILLQVGPTGSSADHSANPATLSDVFVRVGGAAVGKAATSVVVNSNNVIGDDLWIWRGDHSNGVGWTVNTAANGVIVNGNNVTMYGLFVEHYQQYQTIWNGNGGRTYFYQSECPYDVPNQASWMNGTGNGYSSYKVSPTVTSHEAWGVGIYCFFNSNSSVVLDNAIEAPTTGSLFHGLVTISLGGGIGTISHIVNGQGNAVKSGSTKATLPSYP